MRIRALLLLIFAFCAILATAEDSGLRPAGDLTVQDIAAKLAQNNRRRQQELQSYTGERQYHLVYSGFPGRREADLVVEVKYEAPDKKEFTVISESGSKLIVNRVFKKLLETEKEAADEKAQAGTAMTEDNYKFELLGREDVDGRPAYVLHVEPKTENKLLYRGKIWVDAADFAVAKIEAEPAKRPSMWISKTTVHHVYSKVGEFWLPAQNESNTDVRLGGHAILSIHYRDYKVVSEKESPGSNALPDAIVRQNPQSVIDANSRH
jgi:outer membrane lipoprotein-sorting protein